MTWNNVRTQALKRLNTRRYSKTRSSKQTFEWDATSDQSDMVCVSGKDGVAACTREMRELPVVLALLCYTVLQSCVSDFT